jgi:hypothetical protein
MSNDGLLIENMDRPHIPGAYLGFEIAGANKFF